MSNTVETIAALLHDEIAADVEWMEASEYTRGYYRRLAVQVLDEAEPVWRERVGFPYQYGNKIRLSEEAHGPNVFAYAEYPEEAARLYARESNHIELVRRVVGPWEAVNE